MTSIRYFEDLEHDMDKALEISSDFYEELYDTYEMQVWKEGIKNKNIPLELLIDRSSELGDLERKIPNITEQDIGRMSILYAIVGILDYWGREND